MKNLSETAFHKVYIFSLNATTNKTGEFWRESGDFLHGRKWSSLYWVLFSVLVKFDMFALWPFTLLLRVVHYHLITQDGYWRQVWRGPLISGRGWVAVQLDERKETRKREKKTPPPFPVNHISASAERRWLPGFGCFVPQSQMCQSTSIYGERSSIDIQEEPSLDMWGFEAGLFFSCQNSIFCFWNLDL